MFWRTAQELNAEALRLEAAGDSPRAERLYTKALEKEPSWSVPWYNLGLLHKRRRAWGESLRFNLRATELNPTDEAAWWNLGIAATALSDWGVARAAWRGFGIEIPPGEGPIVLNLGLVPIRLDPRGNGEVVWCDRIDPARALIRSIPLPESGRRYKDLLLHDGEPRGTRLLRGREVSVFDEIQLLESSGFSTYSVDVVTSAGAQTDQLVALARSRGLSAEDWTTVRVLCKACSEGSPHDRETCATENQEWQRERLLGIAARSLVEVTQLIDEWVGREDSVEVGEVVCELE